MSKYQGEPIASISSLSKALNIPEDILIKFSKTADNYYQKNSPVIKPNGKERITFRVDESLKAIHDKIKTRLFQKVIYPHYLQGSIRDIKNPRDYMSDAHIHSGNRVIISEDVSDFFPSIKYEMVVKMWMNVFNFPKNIAVILGKLTTFKGYVAQGSKTSSYIGNLIFWDSEPEIQHNLKAKGITYSRYVDDITLSFNRYVSDEELGKLISSIYGMMLKAGVSPNREKQTIVSKKSNTQVHNLNVTKSKPTMPKSKRNNIRMAVFNCKRHTEQHGKHTLEYKKLYQSTMTRIGQLGRLHPNESKKLKNKLALFKPTYDTLPVMTYQKNLHEHPIEATNSVPW